MKKRLWAYSLVGFFYMCGYNMIRTPLLPLFAQKLGASLAGIGWVVAASTITGILFKPISGVVSDLYGRKMLFVIAGCLFAFPSFVYPVLDNTGWLVVLRLIHGLATGIFSPIIAVLVAQINPEKRGRNLGIYSASATAGAMLGPFIGGICIQYIGFRHTFWMAGLLGTVGVVMALLTRRGMVDETSIQPITWRKGIVQAKQGFTEVLSSAPIRMASLVQASQVFLIGTFTAFVPLYAAKLGYAYSEVGLLFAVQSAITIIAKPIAGKLSDQYSRPRIVVVGAVLGIVAFVSIVYVQNFFFMLVTSMFFGIAEGLTVPSLQALVADLAKRRSMGAAMGVLGMVNDIGRSMGLVFSGVFVTWMGLQDTFLVYGAIVLGVICLFLIAVWEGIFQVPKSEIHGGSS